MTAAPTPPSPLPRRRGRALRLAVVLVLVVVVAAGLALLLAPLRARLASPPAPPEIPADRVEPAVVAVLRKARAAVVQAPRSGRAWGELGEAFFGNDLAE